MVIQRLFLGACLLYISTICAITELELPSRAYQGLPQRVGEGKLRIGGKGITATTKRGMTFTFSGLVKNELFWDTRQLNADREGDSVNFPLDRKLDPNGKDINSNGDFNILAIQTTVNANLYGLKLGGADLAGVLNIDFRGVTNCVVQEMRNVNVFVDASWKSALLRLGRFWNPGFVTDCYPQTISYSAGSPFEMIGNIPQIRVVGEVKGVDFIVAACTEINDLVSNGPFEEGVEVVCNIENPSTFTFDQNVPSSTFFRNNLVPVMYVQIRKNFNDKHLIQAGFNVRSLRPRLYGSTDGGTTKFKVNERITSASAFILGKVVIDPVTIKTKFIFAENEVAAGMLGGYGIQSINPDNDQREYTNLRGLNYWLDVSGGARIQPGVFFGLFKNMGTASPLVDINDFPNDFSSFEEATYGFGRNIDWYFIVAPRLLWTPHDMFSIGLEFLVYHTLFGTVNCNGKVDNTHAVNDFRTMCAGYFYF